MILLNSASDRSADGFTTFTPHQWVHSIRKSTPSPSLSLPSLHSQSRNQCTQQPRAGRGTSALFSSPPVLAFLSSIPRLLSDASLVHILPTGRHPCPSITSSTPAASLLASVTAQGILSDSLIPDWATQCSGGYGELFTPLLPLRSPPHAGSWNHSDVQRIVNKRAAAKVDNPSRATESRLDDDRSMQDSAQSRRVLVQKLECKRGRQLEGAQTVPHSDMTALGWTWAQGTQRFLLALCFHGRVSATRDLSWLS